MSGLSADLYDYQTELALQQKKETFANAICCMPCLQQIQTKAKTVQINVKHLSNLIVCACGCVCEMHLFYELGHADTLSLVKGHRAAKTIELPRQSQRRQTFGAPVECTPGETEGFP